MIQKVFSDEGVVFVRLGFGEHLLSAMLLEGGNKLQIDTKVYAIFKESEVMICEQGYTKISARNRFTSKVLKTEVSLAIARVVFEFEGMQISSLISTEAFNELQIQTGKTFQWFIKSSEVMLEYV